MTSPSAPRATPHPCNRAGSGVYRAAPRDERSAASRGFELQDQALTSRSGVLRCGHADTMPSASIRDNNAHSVQPGRRVSFPCQLAQAERIKSALLRAYPTVRALADVLNTSHAYVQRNRPSPWWCLDRYEELRPADRAPVDALLQEVRAA